jgi:lipoprotein signal peptidase
MGREMTETYIEKRKRGFFGWVFLILFIGWNALMMVWLIGFSMRVNEVTQGADLTQIQNAGYAVGAGLGGMMILFVWVMGAVITGLLALLTRGSKTVVVKKG